MFGNDFHLTLNALIDGAISVDQALAIAEEQRGFAGFTVDMNLQEVVSKSNNALDSPGGRLLEFVWKFFGPHSCIEYHFIVVRQFAVAELFVESQLSENPEQFSDPDMRLVAQDWPKLAPRITEIQQKRIGARANLLLSQPRELNADVRKVQDYVSEYSFSPDLNKLLNKVEAGLAGSKDDFDHAALLKHVRTFFEILHKQVAEQLQQEKPAMADNTDLSKCQQAIDYLERKEVLTEKMKNLGRSLYGVLSEQGVHALKTDREYVRLCRNMVAEYALILFHELDRRLKEP